MDNEIAVVNEISEVTNPEQVIELTIEGDSLMLPDLKITSDIAKFKNLEKLTIECRGDIDFPPEMSSLINLKEFFIDECGYMGFPDFLLDLKNLELIDVQVGKKGLPDLRVFRKLKVLRISSVQSLPPSIKSCYKLEDLNVSGKISSLPKEIRELKKLKKLYLAFGDFNALPKHVCFLENLEKLDISWTYIDELPLEIKNLKKLKVLKFTKPFEHHGKEKFKTRVLQIRQVWGELTNLEKLDLGHQKILDVSSNVKKWTKLKELDLSYNEMKEFPTELCEIKSLEKLNLNFNNFKDLPKEFANFKNLQVLDVNGIKFKSIPEVFFKLKNLKKIDLRNTGLAESDIKKLKKALPKIKIQEPKYV